MDTYSDIPGVLGSAQTGNRLNAVGSAMPSVAVCERARKSRDPRFDGRFFIGVLTTGIYCRTICPARLPHEANVRYYPSAGSAQDAGFRPCRRCRPEAALRLPEWTLSSDTVLRGLRHIEAGFLNDHSSVELAAKLDVGERQLSRLFAQELGTTPKTIAKLSRAKLAKKLIQSTSLPQVDIAYHAGYGSISRFNTEVRSVFDCTPTALRKNKRTNVTAFVQVTLPTRGPYNFDWVFTYLQKRALRGIEQVTREADGWVYRRLLERADGQHIWITVQQRGEELVAQLPLVDEPMHSLLARLRSLFDLNADGATVHESLVTDQRLGPSVTLAPGLRVPGAWDGFELGVRAILGQQVSVARGTDLANNMIVRYGDGLFPTPAQLVDREVAELGMPGRRGRAISHLAHLVMTGEIAIDECQDYERIVSQLQGMEGIGPWTANYIRMRALKDPDAFPDNDWVVMKELKCTAAKARQAARAWQPWRAYGLMYLWFAAGQRRLAQ